MPDLSYIDSLCQSLEVSMNELISGERLSESIYSHKAEENIMNLMKENVASEKKFKYGTIAGCIIVFASFLLLFYLTSGGIGGAFKFLDVSGLLFLILFQVAIVFIAKPSDKKSLLNLLSKISIPCGGFVSLFYIATLLYDLSDLQGIGPNLMVGILTTIYALVEYMIVSVISARIRIK